MRFIVDAQLPPIMARRLSARGFTAEHVADIGLRDADDSAIWRYAQRQRAAILTKDDDFPRRLHQTTVAPVIIWLRIGNTSPRRRPQPCTYSFSSVFMSVSLPTHRALSR